jgi:hypothetical protein
MNKGDAGMFVQVIRARVEDPEGVEAAFERWRTDLRPGAEGFLGSTGGVTPDGELIALARFENEALARRNSDRPEQDEWWQELESNLATPATFQESSDVDLLLDGGSDDAGFVQVIVGQVGDRDAARQAMAELTAPLRRERPDIIGGYMVWHDGGFTEVVYFTSEEAARRGEAAMASSELPEMLARANVTMDQFLDLPHPMTTS